MPRDTISIERIKLLHPAIRDLITKAIDRAECGLPINTAIRIVQGLRTISEQDALYAKGRTSSGPIITNAKGGRSFHNYGLAVDFALLLDRNSDGTYETLSWSMIADADKDGIVDWSEIVSAFESFGFSWGGKWRTFKDYPHLEMTFGHDWRWYLDQYNKGNFIPGTQYVAIS